MPPPKCPEDATGFAIADTQSGNTHDRSHSGSVGNVEDTKIGVPHGAACHREKAAPGPMMVMLWLMASSPLVSVIVPETKK
jgi:hypothetical protein